MCGGEEGGYVGRGDVGGLWVVGQKNKTAPQHMDFLHVNQYSSPDLPVGA